MKSFLSLGAFVAAASVALLAGCSNAPAAHETPPPEVLSASAAGVIYLEAVCPVNDAWDTADLELDRLELSIASGGTDTSRVADALGAVAKSSEVADAALAPETLSKQQQAWPDSAGQLVDDVRATLQGDAKQARQVAALTAPEIVAYTWQGADAIKSSAAAAREALGLPADGANACAQWREQQAAADTPEKDTEQ